MLSIWSRPVDGELVIGAELGHTVKLDSNIVGRLRLKQDKQIPNRGGLSASL